MKSVWDSFRLLDNRSQSKYVAVVGARVLVNVLDLVGVAAVGFLSALLALNLSTQASISFLGVELGPVSNQDFLKYVISVGGLFLAKTLLGAGLLFVTTRLLASIEAKAAGTLVNALFSGSLSRMKQLSRGDIQWAITGSSNAAFAATLFAGAALIAEGSLLILIFAFFVVVDGATALGVALYFGLIIGGFQFLVARRQKRIGKTISDYAVRLNDDILGLIGAFREIVVSGSLGSFRQKVTQSRTTIALEQGRYRFLIGSPRFVVEAALMVGLAGIISVQSLSGDLSSGLVTTGVFLSGGIRMIAALLPFQNAISDIRLTAPQADRARAVISSLGVFDQLLSKGATVQNTEPHLDSFDPSIEISNVSFTYPGSQNPAVQEVSINLESGNTIALVGKSGSGKSTMADLLLGLLEPDAGTINIGGLKPSEIWDAKPSLLGYLPQKTVLLPGTLLENISLASDYATDRDRAWSLLRALGLEESVRKLPDGIHSILGSHDGEFSGGQIQRIGVARALFWRPRLLVLDEATSALDSENEVAVLKTIKSEVPGCTTVVIAHRLSTIESADLVVVLNAGRIEAQGNFEELRSSSVTLKRLIGEMDN